MTDTDNDFLREFKLVMRPVAEGLTALEGNIFFGAYLPHLFGIRSQLDRLKQQNLRFCNPLVKAIDEGFIERFKDVMDPYHVRSVPLYLAMITNPKYKLSFMGQLRPTILIRLKNMLLSAAEEILEETQIERPTKTDDKSVEIDEENDDEEVRTFFITRFKNENFLNCFDVVFYCQLDRLF